MAPLLAAAAATSEELDDSCRTQRSREMGMCGTGNMRACRQKQQQETEWDERVSPPAHSLVILTKLVSVAADKCSSVLEKKKLLEGGRI